MFGVIVNAGAIVVGSIIGLFAKKIVSEKVSKAVMLAMGLFSVYIGIKGALVGEKTLVALIALVLGTLIGTMIDLDKYITIFGEFLKKKFTKAESGSTEKFVDAFITGSVLFGVGAMAIMGSIEAGIQHKYDIFYIKSTMDFVSSIMLTASMGIGVAFSAITIFVCQGTMTLLAGSLKFIAENQGMMNEISCVGNIIIFGIGLNLLGATKIKIANMAPAIIMAPIIYYIASLI